MQQDTSWQALTRPGETTSYFGLRKVKPLQNGINEFNVNNAWWLAEISRLVYQPEFHLNLKNKLGRFKYKHVANINSETTSTHVSVLKVDGINNDGYPAPCLVVAFRGTDDIIDWHTNIKSFQKPYDSFGNIHEGFYDAYASIKNDLFVYLYDFGLPIFVTGHSLGGALATLLTAEIMDKQDFDSCYTFGSPRVGDSTFAEALDGKRIYRVINNSDIVTTVPTSIPNTDYKHCGKTKLLNDFGILIEGLPEEEILDYQKKKMLNIPEDTIKNFFSGNIKSLAENVPPVLSDHAPINYVLAIENLI